MKRRDFLKSFGIGVAATASNLSLSWPATRDAITNIFVPVVKGQEVVVTGFDWYIDSIAGNDNNDGLSSKTPVKTFATLINKPITAGQKVGIRSGSVFREMLTIPSSGSAGSPITYKSYGSGAAPRLLGSQALSGWTQTGIPAVSADIISEGFETTKPTRNGYDAGIWAEHIGSSSVVDSDNADVARPDGSTQVLKIQKVSPNYEAEIEKDLGTEQAISFTSVNIYIAAEGLASGESVSLVRERAASYSDVMDIFLNKSGTQLRFAIAVYNDGTTNYIYRNITTGQWYLVNLKYDYTHKNYEMWVDGVQIASGTLTGTLRPGIQILDLGDSSNSKTLMAYFDGLKISSANYATSAVALPANCYRASINSMPNELYFEQTTGKVRRGLQQTTMASCNAEFKWCFHKNGYVVLYAASDPSTRYKAVEGGVRKNCIAHNNQTYITIDGLEVAYSVQDTISVASNWTVQYCNSHHADIAFTTRGAKFGGVYGGNASNCVVRFCTIHDHPCKGVQFAAENGASISGNLIEHNVFYNNSDYSVDCQVFYTGNAHTGLIIQYNEFYTTPDWDTTNPDGASGIFTKGRSGYPMVGPIVRYNLFHDMGGNGVEVGSDVSAMQIYNNTFARTLSGYTGNSNAIYSHPSSISCTIKNNIGYGFVFQMYIAVKSKVTADYNCWFNPGVGFYIFAGGTYYWAGDFAAYKAATGWDAHGVWADPMLVSASDLRLQDGSPCIGAGVNMGITRDYAGMPVGNPPEIGAYEK